MFAGSRRVVGVPTAVLISVAVPAPSLITTVGFWAGSGSVPLMAKRMNTVVGCKVGVTPGSFTLSGPISPWAFIAAVVSAITGLLAAPGLTVNGAACGSGYT